MQTKIKLIKRSIYVFLLLYPLCISAQISKFYLPDNGNVLPISKPNDIKLSVDLPTVGEIHTKVNLGYSPFKHFQVTSGIFKSKSNKVSRYRTKILMGDIGVGMYYFIKSQKSQSRKYIKRKKKWMMDYGVLLNGQLGYSRGITNLNRQNREDFGKFVLDKKYLQLGAHCQTNLLGASGVIRIGRLKYKSGIVRGLASKNLAPLVETLIDRNVYSFVEGSVRLFLGTKFGQFNIGFVMFRVGPNLDKMSQKDYRTLGCIINIQDIFKKIKK